MDDGSEFRADGGRRVTKGAESAMVTSRPQSEVAERFHTGPGFRQACGRRSGSRRPQMHPTGDLRQHCKISEAVVDQAKNASRMRLWSDSCRCAARSLPTDRQWLRTTTRYISSTAVRGASDRFRTLCRSASSRNHRDRGRSRGRMLPDGRVGTPSTPRGMHCSGSLVRRARFAYEIRFIPAATE